jgi:branched-chain amino acid aminotransferase
MQYINCNGKLIKEEEIPLSFFNRGLFYGDGFFETMVMMQGKIPLLSLHWQRIVDTALLLRGKLAEVSKESLGESIHQLVVANKLTHARIRIQFIRSGKGMYLPSENTFDYIIQVKPLETEFFEVKKVAKVGIHSNFVKPISAISYIKSSSAQWYVLGAQLAHENDWDEMLLLNSEENIVEALSSNVIAVIDGKICTPPISDGGVDGTMRKFLLQNFAEIGEVRSLTKADVLAAEEVWLINAVRGIQSVTSFENRVYGNKKAVELTASLNKLCFG